jgi:Pentapeptide repeats (8 copies)
VCFAVVVSAGATQRVLGATQILSAHALTRSCPHPPAWKPTERELHRILARHAGWLDKVDKYHLGAPGEYLDHVKPAYPDWRRDARSLPEQANFCNADLAQAQLSSANLAQAQLSRAVLYGAQLIGARLDAADLYDADLTGANLSGANLTLANLSGANLTGADLASAHLDYTNLSRANLSAASLNGARLRAANLGKSRLDYADLTGATYDPLSESPAPYVDGIRGLSTLNIPFGRQLGLIQLRKLLQDGGLRDAEREATYAIERSRTADQLFSPSWNFRWILGVARFVGFDVTTAYGLHPTRALEWIMLLGAVLTPVYMLAMLHPSATSGVVQVFPRDRLDGTAGDPADEKERKKKVVQARDWRDAFRPAVYFSLVSALNIGFQQFTPGDWLRRLQGREYSLEAVGWVRTVAGAQALLSVFLLAMWVLTQFGRPFE